VSEPVARRGPARRIAVAVLPPLAVSALVVGAWTWVSYVTLDEHQRSFLPPPQDVVRDGFLDGQRPRTILEGLWRTTQITFTGLVIAWVLGTLIAVVLVQARWIERAFYPYAVVLQTVPLVAVAPIIGLQMGYSHASQVVICVVISLFPIIANTLFGLRSVDPGQHDLLSLHGAGRLTRLRTLQLPAALPAIFTGLRISAGLSVIGAIVGEFFYRQGDPSQAGLGRQLSVYQSRQQTHFVITALVFSCLLGILLFAFFTVLGRLLTRAWYVGADRPVRPARSRSVGAGSRRGVTRPGERRALVEGST